MTGGEQEQELFGQTQTSGGTFKDRLLMYLSYWPLFLLFMALCIGAGFIYIRYATPQYMATSAILVKDEQSGVVGSTGKGNNGTEDLIRAALSGEKKVNIDNELRLMRAPDLIKRIIKNENFNISYYKNGKVKNVNIYKDAPFELVPLSIKDSTSKSAITVKDVTGEGAVVLDADNKNAEQLHIKWAAPFSMHGNKYTLFHKNMTAGDENAGFLVTWTPVEETVADILSNLSVDVPDKKTSIIQMKIITENLKLGPAILDAVFKEFNETDLKKKNDASNETIRFIDDRLAIISQELNGVEGNLESFQGANEIVNVNNQTSQSFENSNDAAKSLNNINVQMMQIEQIQNYFNNATNQEKLVISNLGITDPTLISLITQYNEIQLKKEREAPLLASKSMLLKDYDNQLQLVKASILENLQNIAKNLKSQETNVQQRSAQYRQFLNALPHKERAMQEIKRKQSITEAIYLYLLQKREETAISSKSSNIAAYEEIEQAKGYGPVKPSKGNIMMFAAMLGLVLPMGLVFLSNLLNDRINTKADVVSKIQAPIIGELSHIKGSQSKFITGIGRDLLGEEFRALRTNLFMMLKKNAKNIIMVTSSNIGEGKSLVSSNLATVIAMPGKKVALLELDVRQPQIAKNFGLKNERGLAQYLSGEEENLLSLYQTSEIPNLHIYTSGIATINPADLLVSDRVRQLFEILKSEYDFVVIDSPPIGLVTDSLILGEYSNAVVYVIRQRETRKKQLDLINDIYKSGKLSNVTIVINDVKTGGKYGTAYKYGLNYEHAYGEQVKKGFFRKYLAV